MKVKNIINPVFFIAILLSLTGLFTSSCYYDNMEELNPKDTSVAVCDTVAPVTYTKHIAPIMENYCNSCHSGGTPSGAIDLTTYSSVKNQAVSGKLYSAVAWDGQASQMPKGATSKIDDCSIEQIKKWIATDYKE